MSISKYVHGVLVLALLGSVLGAGNAHAQVLHTFEMAVDADSSAATGCDFVVTDAGLPGVADPGYEVLLTLTVDSGQVPPMVIAADVSDCNTVSGNFEFSVSLPGTPWPVGLDNGTAGSDVVEGFLPLDFPTAGEIRLGFRSLSFGGAEDALITTTGAQGAPPITVTVESVLEIPTLSTWGLLALALLLTALGLALLRRRRSSLFVSFVALATAAGLLYAAVPDGMVGEWIGGPIATDVVPDSLPADAAAEIVATFAAVDAGDLCMRLDIVDLENSPLTALDDAFNVNEDLVDAALDVLANDMDPDPGDTLTIIAVDSPTTAGGTATISPVATPNNMILYTPPADYNGPDSFTYTVEESGGGLTDTATVNITVDPVNDAPILDNTGTMFLSAIDEDALNPAGDLVSGIIASAGGDRITDIDPGAVEGLAVTGRDNGNGTWEFSTDGGLFWTPFGVLSDATATVLSAAATDRIRFVPAANFNGSVDPGITFRAWDTTSGQPTGTQGVDTTTNGGITAFSTATETASIVVNPINDPPVKTPGGGGPAAFIEGGGPVAVDPGVTVTDVDSPNLVTATVTITNLLDAGLETLAATPSGAIGAGDINYAAPTLTIAPGGGAAVADFQAVLQSVTYDNTSIDPDETDRVLDCTANDGLANSNTLMQTVTVTAVNAPPMAGADSYDTVGNTELVVGTGGPAASSLATVALPGASVLDNDTDPELTALTVVGFDAASVLGGTVNVDAAGRFTYLPPKGVSNMADSFTYDVQDAGGAMATGTVTINIVDFRVWYVHNDPAGEPLNPVDGADNGRSDDPFDLLAGAGAVQGADDLLCVYQGDGTTAGMNAGIVLSADNATLHGEHEGCQVPLSLNGLPAPEVLLAPTPNNHPLISHTAGNAIAVDASAGNVTGVEIRGVSLSATGGNALDVSSAGANAVEVLFENSRVTAAGAEGVDVNHASSGLGTVTVNNLSTFTAAGNAFDARTTGTGDLHIAFTNNPNVTSTGGTAVLIDGSGGAGRPFVTAFSGNSVSQATAGLGLDAVATAFDAVPGGSFDPVNAGAFPVGDVTGPNRIGGVGVRLGAPGNPVEGNLTFGDLDIAATGGGLIGVGSGPAMAASGFQLNVTTGTIDALNGPAVDLDPLTAGISLATVTSTNSPTSGIALTDISGTFSAGGGSSITGAVGDSFLVTGGTVSSTYQGSITHTSGGTAAVRVLGGHSAGTVVFDTGTISAMGATAGLGLQFDNADGDYDFNGTTTLNGGDAGVDIQNGSSGTFDFVAAVAITHAGAGPAFRINNSAATVDHNGTITDANGFAVDILTLLAGGSARFDGQVSASGAGLTIGGAAGTVDFANADLTNTATVDIDNNTAAITFADLSLDQTAGAVNAFDVATGSSPVLANLTGVGLRSATPNRLVNVTDRAGSTVTFQGAATLQGTGGNTGINVSGGTAANTVTFAAAVDLGTGIGNRITGGGVSMTGNVAGSAVSFNSLDVFTSGVPGIAATGAGLLDTETLPGAVNIDTTGNGASALDLDGILTNLTVETAVCNTNSNCVDLTNLAAGSVNRLAGLGLACSAGTCLNGNAARTVEVTGAGNTIAATGAVGLSLTDTTIGANNATFQAISASGAANGIVLDNTGTTGDFTITGDGGAAQNGSGGTIQNTTGDAISLTTAEDISIDQVAVSNIGRHGVSGFAVNNFTLTNSTFTNVGDANEENVLDFRVVPMSGTAAITGTLNLTNVDVTDFHDTGLAVLNESSAVTVNVTNCDFDDNDDTDGTDAVFVESQMTAAITLNVTGGLFNDLEGDVVVFEGGGSGTNDVNILNTRSTNGGGPDDFPNGGGIEVRVSNGRTVTFDIQGNDLRDQRGDPLIIAAPVGAGGGNLEGRVGGPNPGDGNTFSGSSLGDGIQLTLEGPNSNFTILVQNNDIGVDNTGMGGPFNGLGDDGLQVLHRDNAGTLNLTIEGNRFANTVSEAIRIFSDEDTAIGPNNPTNNIRIANNDFTNIDTDNNENEIELRTSDTARACYHVIGNDNGAAGSPGVINFSIAGTSTGEITQASTAVLSADNAGATIAGDAPATGGTCTNPALPMN